MQTAAFGYKCQECGQGTVLEKVFPEYKTKLKGYPLTVENARIGVCDRCGAEHFDPNETVRWRTLLEDKQSQSTLQPADIRELHKRLGLSMEQFAILLGCTRQSLYNWERTDRPSPQSRMADLFMRLIRESHALGQINVLSFLTAEAEKLGFHFAFSPRAKPIVPIVAMARKISRRLITGEAPEPLTLADDTEAPPDTVVLVTEHDQAIARVFHDYERATLNLAFMRTVPFTEFDAQIHFKDGTQSTGSQVKIKDKEAILLDKTARTEEDVVRVVLLPQALVLLSTIPSK